jgi:choline dehydrogenase-like flavoprotein
MSDVALLQMSSEFVNRLTEQAPMSKIVVERQFPVAHDAQDLEDWVRSTAAVSPFAGSTLAITDVSQSGSHPAGTAAMVPRSMGGVVDSSLKVYGTSNVRVVDASIFPIHIAAHTQATIYAISEKVSADMTIAVNVTLT